MALVNSMAATYEVYEYSAYHTRTLHTLHTFATVDACSAFLKHGAKSYMSLISTLVSDEEQAKRDAQAEAWLQALDLSANGAYVVESTSAGTVNLKKFVDKRYPYQAYVLNAKGEQNTMTAGYRDEVAGWLAAAAILP